MNWYTKGRGLGWSDMMGDCIEQKESERCVQVYNSSTMDGSSKDATNDGSRIG
jgi:hypothetical protein